MSEQIWKTVAGFENYEISNLGKVRNSSKGNYLTGTFDKDGYLKARLTKNGKSKSKYIHRLVAEAFIDNPEGLEQVDHINKIKTDNRVENLRWISCSGNNFNRRSCGERIFEFVDDVPKPFVKISQYGKHIFDRLYYSGLTEKFYMLVDQEAGFREIIPCSRGNYYIIYCHDISNKQRCMGFAKLKNYAIDLLELKYEDLLSELTDDDIVCLLNDGNRSDILMIYDITDEELDSELERRNIINAN